ncbi:hypothetical protein HK097_011093 [Rhizophlyctis rosea]|uniref:AB hydrolase-1 domain-containing protein n=1 Tax=Rhizophlyctis rosea TaxID=64517 RepID=A0AAD5S958_9FUNG|nr:hypothetical protein HK097_011093 [Rhizophlyctis rosea]
MTQTDYITTTDGAKIAYRVLNKASSAIPAILVAGISSVKEDWGAFAEELAKHRPVIIFDNRGIGFSTLSPPLPPSRTPPPVTILQLATDTFSLLEYLHYTTFHLLGMSLGGMISLQLSLLLRGRDDFRCASLTLLCTTAKAPRRNPFAMLYFQLGEWLRLGKFDDRRKGEFEEELWGLLFSPAWYREKRGTEEGKKIMERYRSGNRPYEIIMQQFMATSSFDVTDQLHLISIPTLVVHAAGDRILPFEGGEVIAEGVKGAKFHPLSQDIGHMMMDMDNGETATAVSSFLSTADFPKAKL